MDPYKASITDIFNSFYMNHTICVSGRIASPTKVRKRKHKTIAVLLAISLKTLLETVNNWNSHKKTNFWFSSHIVKILPEITNTRNVAQKNDKQQNS